MPNPSLLIVPARFKTGRLYSQIPSNTDNRGDFNVTRATAATRVNSAGLIESVASGIPRLDYFASGGVVGCPALLVEPSGSNLIVQSENWLASGWRSDATANVTTVSSTTGTLDPLGTNTANAISPTSGNTSHLKVGSDASISFTSGTVYTASAFFKQGVGNAGRYVQIAWPSTRFAANTFANFDLQLGTVALVTGSTVTAGIENYGNGWYRCRCTNTCISTGTGANGISIALIEASGATRLPTFSGTTTDILYGWGAQLETGSVATSYIPTTTASVTRNAEVISTANQVSGCIGQTEGTVYAEIVNTLRTYVGFGYVVRVYADDNNEVWIRKEQSTNTYTIRWRANSQDTTFTSISVPNGASKIAIGYKSGDTAVFLNGSQVGTTNTDVRAFSVGPNTVALGSTGFDAYFRDRIRSVALYTTRLSNAELQALTT